MRQLGGIVGICEKSFKEWAALVKDCTPSKDRARGLVNGGGWWAVMVGSDIGFVKSVL